MLGDNQTLYIQPCSVGITISLETHYEKGATLITHHVKYPGNMDGDGHVHNEKYEMAIEAAIIYLQKKTENSEY